MISMVRLFTDYEGDNWPYSKLRVRFLEDKINNVQNTELAFPQCKDKIQPPQLIPRGTCRTFYGTGGKYIHVEITLKGDRDTNQVVLALGNDNCRRVKSYPQLSNISLVYAAKYDNKALITISFPIEYICSIFTIQRIYNDHSSDFVVVTDTNIFVVGENDLNELIKEYELPINNDPHRINVSYYI